jgi:tRNA threonylcarbamoyladenosine biosynthesis protein TsaB
MLILTIRTDKPEAELGLYEDDQQLAYLSWQAHRELAETIHFKIDELLGSQKASLPVIGGVVVFQGPGSFTGLRIGLSVANALAYGLAIPIAAAQGEGWVQTGLNRLREGKNDTITLPEYGAPPNITMPKK